MKIDFDRLTERRGTLSYKWDVKCDELPMWVADMDFEAPEPVKREICAIAEHGIYGYSTTPNEYFDAVRDFSLRRHGVAYSTSDMIYSSGVVAALSSMVRRFSLPAEYVLIQAPVYNIFYNSIVNNGRRVLSSDLVYSDGGYSIDFSDLERKMSLPEVSMMILCNPHNPVGKVFSKEELLRIGELAEKNGVVVISDEIHRDFIRPGVPYTPFAAAGEVCRKNSVSCISASKTFNIAGLQSACLVAENPSLRYRAWRGVNTDEVGEPNIFAIRANIAAYTECDEWVDRLVEYVYENRRIAESYINDKIPGLFAIHADATYLLWIDISSVSDDSVDFCERLRLATGLYLSDGAEYGEPGRRFVRMNLATQRGRVLDGLERLARGVELIKSNRA